MVSELVENLERERSDNGGTNHTECFSVVRGCLGVVNDSLTTRVVMIEEERKKKLLSIDSNKPTDLSTPFSTSAH